MSTIDPFELLKKLRDADIDQVVGALRKFHRTGAGGIPSIDEILGANTEQQLSNSVRNDARYEALKRHFVPHAERLRQQSLLAEQLLKQYGTQSEAEAAVVQEQIRIKVHPGATSGGRFALVNSLGKAGEIHFRAGHIERLPSGREADVEIEFHPDRSTLEPGEKKIIDIKLRLEAAPPWPDSLLAGFEVMSSEVVLMKLWIHIDVQPSGELE